MGNKRPNRPYYRIDIPSAFLHRCFYCGDTSTEDEHCPPVSRYYDYIAVYDKHPALIVPSCRDCNNLLGNSLQATIYQRFNDLKTLLLKKYGKYLRLGSMWEEGDADYYGFTGRYRTMVDAMPRLSKQYEDRINWQHWPLSIDGVDLDTDYEEEVFTVVKKKFSSLTQVFEYARKVDKIPEKYLDAVIKLVGEGKLEYAYNYCKTVKVKTTKEMNKALADLEDLLR